MCVCVCGHACYADTKLVNTLYMYMYEIIMKFVANIIKHLRMLDALKYKYGRIHATHTDRVINFTIIIIHGVTNF